MGMEGIKPAPEQCLTAIYLTQRRKPALPCTGRRAIVYRCMQLLVLAHGVEVLACELARKLLSVPLEPCEPAQSAKADTSRHMWMCSVPKQVCVQALACCTPQHVQVSCEA
jgi:hypothetical protein